MKHLFIYTALLLFASKTLSAKNIQTISDQPSAIAKILPAYFAMKDALVASDAKTAGLKAEEFEKIINTLQTSSLSQAQKNTFKNLKDRLVFDADHISKSDDINHQRDHFKDFSANVWTLAKALKLSDTPVYLQYCPMKKASWLSNETEIKNPYYGKSMLTCGSVTETIK